jgi:hypothetical protein
VPVLNVLGIPAELQNDPALAEFLLAKLPEAAASVPEMEITPGLVTAFAPGDLLDMDLSNEIIVIILGLFGPPKKPKRTPDVLERFAQALCDCVVEFAQKHVSQCGMIEVFDAKDPNNCFADWRKPA